MQHTRCDCATCVALRAAGAKGRGIGSKRARELRWERYGRVVTGMAKGWTLKRIAAELSLSEHTLKNNMRRMYVEMGATNGLNAVAIGIKRGMVDLDEIDG